MGEPWTNSSDKDVSFPRETLTAPSLFTSTTCHDSLPCSPHPSLLYKEQPYGPAQSSLHHFSHPPDTPRAPGPSSDNLSKGEGYGNGHGNAYGVALMQRVLRCRQT
ncbi:unnamed protein product [Pleuronectes platessa]|uniref:Uncharacterized protein n=1 Tax=Pleuronectes platessa TaxID=8262 RepID=A0A9N7TN90_PLEPL|nr:unnamed protein product [Pleuronectes platessa]